MAQLSRVGDQCSGGGKIVNGAGTVFANGIAVGLHVSSITSHDDGPHRNASTTSGSPTVFVEGKPVLRVGSSISCGHSVTQGSPDVNCS
jgi:uncharacterized Zn-binding protein involved in type VI secretion